MKASDLQYQLLADEATTLYNSEKEISGIFDALKINTDDTSLKQGINLEAKENKRHCTRLEGLLEVLNRNPYKYGNYDEASKQSFIQQFTIVLKRTALQHADFGYKTAVFVALAPGQNEIANLLRLNLGSGSHLLTK